MSESEIEEILVQEKNIGITEEILNKENIELLKLKNKGVLDAYEEEPNASSSEIDNIAPEVYREVNQFLNLEENKFPKIEYVSNSNSFLTGISETMEEIVGYVSRLEKKPKEQIVEYDPVLKKIILSKNPLSSVVLDLAHEYTHYLQDKKLSVEVFDNNILMEGHARGVEKNIAKTYADKKDKKNCLIDVYTQSINELKNTYQWICDNLNKVENERLLKDSQKALENTIHEIDIDKYSVDDQSIGNTLFSIYEQTQGNRVYRDFIRENSELIKEAKNH